jgi:hypothetical protein
MLMEYLRKISQLQKADRRNAILAILDELNTPYAVYHGTFNNKWVNNVAVPFHKGGKRFVLSAHYDNVDNSTGANDNAAGCAILLELIRTRREILASGPFEILFFDDEEHGRSGSQLYIKDNEGKFIGMTNLDLVGVGDTLVVGSEANTQHPLFKDAVSRLTASGRHPLRVARNIPVSDQQSFEAAGIPNMFLSVIPSTDFEMLEVMADCIRSGKPLTPENIAFVPTVMQTIHNKARDHIETVEESAMALCLEFVADLVQNLRLEDV